MTTSTTVNPGVVSFVVLRCKCGKPQPIEAPAGVTIRFWCNDRRCERLNEVIA